MIGELTDNFPDILKTCVLIASGDISNVKTDAAVTVHNYDNINHVVRKIILIYPKRFSPYSYLTCTVGARKHDNLRNKVNKNSFFIALLYFFFTIIHIMLKEHIYKEKI